MLGSAFPNHSEVQFEANVVVYAQDPSDLRHCDPEGIEGKGRGGKACDGVCRELGRKLTWDPVKEEFVGDEEANSLIHRPRRSGFELPDLG